MIKGLVHLMQKYWLLLLSDLKYSNDYSISRVMCDMHFKQEDAAFILHFNFFCVWVHASVRVCLQYDFSVLSFVYVFHHTFPTIKSEWQYINIFFKTYFSLSSSVLAMNVFHVLLPTEGIIVSCRKSAHC